MDRKIKRVEIAQKIFKDSWWELGILFGRLAGVISLLILLLAAFFLICYYIIYYTLRMLFMPLFVFFVKALTDRKLK